MLEAGNYTLFSTRIGTTFEQELELSIIKFENTFQKKNIGTFSEKVGFIYYKGSFAKQSQFLTASPS